MDAKFLPVEIQPSRISFQSTIPACEFYQTRLHPVPLGKPSNLLLQILGWHGRFFQHKSRKPNKKVWLWSTLLPGRTKKRQFMGSYHRPTWGSIEKAKTLSFSFIKSFYTQVSLASSQAGTRARVGRISLRKNTNTRNQKPKNRWYSFFILWL